MGYMVGVQAGGVFCQLHAVGPVGPVSFVGSGSAAQPAELLQDKTAVSLPFTTLPSQYGSRLESHRINQNNVGTHSLS